MPKVMCTCTGVRNSVCACVCVCGGSVLVMEAEVETKPGWGNPLMCICSCTFGGADGLEAKIEVTEPGQWDGKGSPPG